MPFYITIKKEVQVRHCVVVKTVQGRVRVAIYVEGIQPMVLDSFDDHLKAIQHCETVQLGGPVDWEHHHAEQGQSEYWESTRVLTDCGGNRLTPAEIDLARKAMKPRHRSSGERAAMGKKARRA